MKLGHGFIIWNKWNLNKKAPTHLKKKKEKRKKRKENAFANVICTFVIKPNLTKAKQTLTPFFFSDFLSA